MPEEIHPITAIVIVVLLAALAHQTITTSRAERKQRRDRCRLETPTHREMDEEQCPSTLRSRR